MEQRIIKFRAWHKESKQMYHSEPADGFDESRTFTPFIFQMDSKYAYMNDDFEIMQFTGISYPIKEDGFDSSGNYKTHQPIYEGDIVEFVGGTVGILHCGIYNDQYHSVGTILAVRWLPSGFTLSLPIHLSESAPNIVGNVGNYDLWKYSGSLKIIGNIHENPELLTIPNPSI